MQTTQLPKTTDTDFRVLVAADTIDETVASHPEAIGHEIEWLYQHYLEEQVTFADLGRRIKQATGGGPDGGHISQVFRNVYQGNYANIAAFIRQYREKHLAEFGTGQPDFIRTTLAVEVFRACDSVRDTREIGLIFGDLGSGKTVAVKEYAGTVGPSVLYFECSESPAFGDFLRQFARALSITAKHPQAIRESLARKLKRRGVTLLIVDEAHAPFETSRSHKGNPGPVRIINFLRREIFDKLGIPIILVGTDTLAPHLKGGIWAKTLEQIRDRGDTELNLCNYQPTREDLQAFFTFYGLDPVPPKPALIAVRDILAAHSLRKLVFRLRKSASAANKAGIPHTWDVFLDVCDLRAAESSDQSDILNRKS